LPVDEVIGRTYGELHSPGEEAEFAEKMDEVFKTGKSALHEHISRRDGRYILRSFSPVEDTEGRVTAVTVVSKDITVLKEAEKERKRLINELEAKNTELERFTYTISHDLRSPLITIRGFATILREDLVEQGKTEDMENGLERIETAAAKMDLLLNDTLQLSRIGRVANPREDVPFGEIVKGALEQTAEQIKSSGVEVSVADGFPTVHVDRMRIEEVLVNLITNSIRYRGDQPSPKIDLGYRVEREVEIEGENKGTVFFVKDNGIGIEKSQHEKVFELFYRLDRSSGGTGAGLAIVKRIIEVHGGRIWIESEKDKGKGKGCTVCFTLPVA
jgi:signal transduction histidine kinase